MNMDQASRASRCCKSSPGQLVRCAPRLQPGGSCCLPAVHRSPRCPDLGPGRQAQAGLRWTGQLSAQDSGAYTGDISGAFLNKLGCAYVLVGHSERREIHQESDELLNSKVKAAYRNEVTPVLCAGEGLEIRQAGTHVEHTLAQVRAGVAGLTAEQAATLVIAYEPVWAIGTGEVAGPEDAQEMCAAIRAELVELFDAETAAKTRLLYGGSVKANNVGAIMAERDVDGVLVGGASLDAGEFANIARFESHLVTK
ncbi:triose-phosphate isomerase [Arthrobacter psychrolactophilus]